MNPRTAIAFKSICDCLSLLLAGIRYFVTRNKSRTKQNIACHVLLFATFVADLAGTCVYAWIVSQEEGLMQEFHGDMELVNAHAKAPIYSKIFYVAHMCYYWSLYLLKAAYLTFYAQLFIKTDIKRRLVLYSGIFITVSCFLSGLIILFTFCLPFNQNWNPNTNPNCPVLFNFDAFAVIASMNIASDIAIISIPFAVVSSLQLEKRERIGLAAVFVIGGSSIIASVIRFVVMGERILQGAFTWDTFHIYAIVSHAEVFFGVIAFCLPTFRLLFVKAVGYFSSQHGNGSGIARTGLHTTTGSYQGLEEHNMRNMGKRKDLGVHTHVWSSSPDSQVDLTASVAAATAASAASEKKHESYIESESSVEGRPIPESHEEEYPHTNFGRY